MCLYSFFYSTLGHLFSISVSHVIQQNNSPLHIQKRLTRDNFEPPSPLGLSYLHHHVLSWWSTDQQRELHVGDVRNQCQVPAQTS